MEITTLKQAIIAPGWPDTGQEPKYRVLKEAFVEQGYSVTILRLAWDKNLMSVWVDQLVQSIDKDADSLTLLGFSMGAMASLIVSTQVRVNTAIICSSAGYFNEYKPFLTDDDLEWAEKNMADFGQFTTSKLFSGFKVEHGYILAGDQELAEWPDFKQWMDDLKYTTRWSFNILPATGHDIGADEYQKQLLSLIHSFS
jgi:predicted alpha/beta hydrolase family esterase